MKHSITIMNFTNVYKKEDFYIHRHINWIDLSNLNGVKYYCDDESKKTINKKLEPLEHNGIHLLDSGNYHYISKFWLDKIKQPFVLVLFDHHTDMQAPLFDSILSCGSWAKEVLDQNPFLKKIILIGAANHLIHQIPKEYKHRIFFFSEEALHYKEIWEKHTHYPIPYPIYISIDKDVLARQYAIPDWDNGSMKLSQLIYLLKIIFHKNKVLGIDICGEYSNLINTIANPKIIRINNQTNKIIIKEILNSWK